MLEYILFIIVVMYIIILDVLVCSGIEVIWIFGLLYVVEYVVIGLLLLVVSCDCGDIGGMFIVIGFEGLFSVFVYDGYLGGVGFVECGFCWVCIWLGVIVEVIEVCECFSGCLLCV